MFLITKFEYTLQRLKSNRISRLRLAFGMSLIQLANPQRTGHFSRFQISHDFTIKQLHFRQDKEVTAGCCSKKKKIPKETVCVYNSKARLRLKGLA